MTQQGQDNTRAWGIFDRILRWMRLRKIIPFVRSDSVLCDLGCGQDMFLLSYFAPMIREGIGFDEIASSSVLLPKNITLVRMNLEDKIPLEDASIDVVTLLAALEHIHQDEMILKEVRRVLRPGGVLLITVPTPFGRPVLELLALLHILNAAEIKDHKRYYNKAQLVGLVERAGFSSQTIKASYWEAGFNLFLQAKKE